MSRFPVNPLGQMWQDMGRLRVIATVLIKHGFGEFISRLNIQDNFITRMLMRRPKKEIQDQSIAKRISLVMQELGPTFIKLGQILSTRPDLIPEEYILEFKQLQSAAAPLDFSEITKQIESSLGKPTHEMFGWIDQEPLASASIAQVHIARLHDGTEVVVKVQRPGIQEVLSSDLSILIFLAKRVAQLFPQTELFDPVGIAEEFDKALSKELDFTVELRNLTRFKKNFKNNTDVHIPTVYRELSCTTILVMERIRGLKITEINTGQKALVRRLLKIVFEMIYIHGFFHGDLHPGNILVEPNGRIGLIDFGLVGRLTPRMKEHITDLLFGLIRSDYDAVAEVLYDIGVKKTTVNYDLFYADVAALVDEHINEATMADIEFGRLFQEILDGAMRHNIAVTPDYTMMFKALITAEGVGKQLDPEMDLLQELEPYILELVKQRYSPTALFKRGVYHVNNIYRLFKQFPITARQVLMAVENGRIQFGLDQQQLDEFIHEFRMDNHRKASVGLSATFLICGTLALDYGPPQFFGLPTLTFFSYLIGLGLAALVVLNMLRNR
ncbi:MAG: hypothetical protein EP343_20645 [Deltaproteobacteria bacterium]|nr:MAG: hypothetical protein EP343_20645 [Deltaproteobacteria bacterium]